MLCTFLACFCAGEIRWQQPQPSGLYSTVPVLNVPDLDGDKLNDVALVASDHTQVHSSEAVYYSQFSFLFFVPCTVRSCVVC